MAAGIVTEVKSPHGRLIDAGSLATSLEIARALLDDGNPAFNQIMRTFISIVNDDAPTVIESEK